MSIILLVGASGSGKTTIGKELERYGVKQLVSFTTRPMRDGEMHGVDYHFTNKEDLVESELAEISYYNGNTYGLSKHEIESKLAKHNDVYFITDRNGAKQLVEMYPDKVKYFWINITIEEMVKRMRQRGDRDEQIIERVEHAIDTGELVYPEDVDCNIITLDANDSVKDLIWIIALDSYFSAVKFERVAKPIYIKRSDEITGSVKEWKK